VNLSQFNFAAVLVSLFGIIMGFLSFLVSNNFKTSGQSVVLSEMEFYCDCALFALRRGRIFSFLVITLFLWAAKTGEFNIVKVIDYSIHNHSKYNLYCSL